MAFTSIFLIIFSLIIVGISYMASKRGAKTAEDYFLAGRSLGVVATFFGLVGTQMSAFIFMGMGAQAYLMGVGAFNQTVAGMVLVVIYLYVWRRQWQLAKVNGYITQADMLVDRFESPLIMRWVPSVLGVVAITVGHFGVQFIATGLIFNVISGGQLPYWFGVLFTAAIVLIVVLLGGLRGTAWTDIFMGSWVIITLLVATSMVLGGLNMSLPQAFQEIATKFPKLVSPPGEIPFWTQPMLIAWLITMLGFTMYPHMHMRSYAAKSEKVFRLNALLWIPAAWLICAIPTTLGIFGRFFWATPKDLPVPPDGVIPMLIAQTAGAPWLVSVVLSGALAAIISTVAGSVIAISAIITNDIIKKQLRPQMADERAVWWGRAIVVLATVISVIIALLRLNLISVLFVSATGIVVLFFIPVVGGMVWPRLNRAGATWGLVLSEIFFLWMTYGPKSMGVGFMNKAAWGGFPPVIWALIVQIVVTVVVTYLTPAPSEVTRKKFFGQVASKA